MTVSVRQMIEHNEEPGSKFYDMTDCPIAERGWCFQERLLGTSLLHFTNSEIVFECRTEGFCECSHKNRQPVQLKTKGIGLPCKHHQRHSM